MDTLTKHDELFNNIIIAGNAMYDEMVDFKNAKVFMDACLEFTKYTKTCDKKEIVISNESLLLMNPKLRIKLMIHGLMSTYTEVKVGYELRLQLIKMQTGG